MKFSSSLIAAFAVSTQLASPAAAEQAPAPLPETCEFLVNPAPVDPAASGYPANEQFRACANELYLSYRAIEEEIRAAAEKSNDDARKAMEEAKKAIDEVAAQVREEMIEDYKSKHNGEITEQALQDINMAVFAELMPYGFALGFRTPPEKTRLGGCLAPYHFYADQIAIMQKYPDIQVQDVHLYWQAADLEKCSGEIAERIERDRQKRKTSPTAQPTEGGLAIDLDAMFENAKGFTAYLSDPDALVAKAQAHQATVQSVVQKAGKRWCTYFMADIDNQAHYKNEEYKERHKSEFLRRCGPLLTQP